MIADQPVRLLQNERGMALIIAISAVALISYMVTETTYETTVEYKLSSSSINDLKAYYAARAGMELSLLRIQIYNKAMHQFGKALGSSSSMLNPIWQMPFVWPPVIPKEAQRIDTESINDAVKESLMKASYLTTISNEGSKIDLNDLDSPSKVLKLKTRQQLLNLLNNRLQSNPDWANDSSFDPEQIVNNIQDWVDEDDEASGGGSESSPYRDYKEGKWPPNRAFRTVEELRLVSGVNEKVYQLIAPRVTIYGLKGINVNLATKEIFRSLNSQITDELADRIIEYREDPKLHGPFKDEKDFLEFMTQEIGVSLNQNDDEKIPINTDAAHNFIITSTGSFARSSKEITAIVYNLSKIQKRLQDFVDKEKPTPTPTPSSASGKKGPTPTPTPSPSPSPEPPPKGRPRVVFWFEK